MGEGRQWLFVSADVVCCHKLPGLDSIYIAHDGSQPLGSQGEKRHFPPAPHFTIIFQRMVLNFEVISVMDSALGVSFQTLCLNKVIKFFLVFSSRSFKALGFIVRSRIYFELTCVQYMLYSYHLLMQGNPNILTTSSFSWWGSS